MRNGGLIRVTDVEAVRTKVLSARVKLAERGQRVTGQEIAAKALLVLLDDGALDRLYPGKSAA
jgi:hypothetical protein